METLKTTKLLYFLENLQKHSSLFKSHKMKKNLHISEKLFWLLIFNIDKKMYTNINIRLN